MGAAVTGVGSGHRSGPLAAVLTGLHSIELVGILCAAMVVASLERAHLVAARGCWRWPWPLRWVIATPQFHHWHHAREPRAYNSNYAGEFPAVDALFGTLYLPARGWPARYGVDDSEPAGYLRQLVRPLAS
jgi:sterol desaturase/sphingolipid hydroxylase (fatty acid hydroxylase superfamily)